jgi:hypothetical protein
MKCMGYSRGSLGKDLCSIHLPSLFPSGHVLHALKQRDLLQGAVLTPVGHRFPGQHPKGAIRSENHKFLSTDLRMGASALRHHFMLLASINLSLCGPCAWG